MKKITSIEKYQRFRGWRHKRDTSKHRGTTANGKMASEYWGLLEIKEPMLAVEEFFKRWDEVNKSSFSISKFSTSILIYSN